MEEKKNKDKKEKQKKKLMTPQRYTVITIVFLGLIVALGIYSNVANWSGQDGVKVEVIHTYEENEEIEESDKVIGHHNGFNNTFVIDIFNNQIWLNNIVLFSVLFACFAILPLTSYYVGTRLRNKSVGTQVLYLILSSLIDLIFYFWLPVALILIVINYLSYKRGLNSTKRKKEKRSEFDNKE